jgi:DnaJ-class molecular chaperone
LELHPDKFGSNLREKEVAEQKFKLVVEAYSVLSDPETKGAYDMKLMNDAFGSGNFGFGASHSSNANPFASAAGFGSAPRRNEQPFYHYHQHEFGGRPYRFPREQARASSYQKHY